jgi:hypothetical protein
MVAPHIQGIRHQIRVHRLVLLAFKGFPRPELECNHINGNKLDNRPENLEWVTASENVLHAFRLGLRVSPKAGSPGERNGRAKLTSEEVLDLRARKQRGEKLRGLAERFGISYSHAKTISARRAWSFLPEISPAEAGVHGEIQQQRKG